MLKQQRQTTSQAGFTLVELAIVMIIIGLLIAGVLKGQELIGNARVTSTVAQIKGIDAAVSTFRDEYQAIPGDITAPTTRLPNCTTGSCATAGNGNGQLDNLANAAVTGEGVQFFQHLNAANLLSGLNPNTGATAWNGYYPESKIGSSGFSAGWVNAIANLSTAVDNVGAPGGLYLTITSTPASAPTAAITPNQASRIDLKLDDGVPGTGGVRSNGGGCASATLYTTVSQDKLCFLHINIQS